MKILPIVIASAGLALAVQPASAATNVLPGHTTGISVTGTHGVLRAGSPWVPNSTPSDPNLPADGIFAPTSQQWNRGSFWWDADPSINQSPVYWEVQLDQSYMFDRFVVQADDNDSYLLEYWDGGAWQTAYAVPFAFAYGLQTRDSGLLSRITTDRFRFSATAGDAYYSVAEIQAFNVPEPGTWALMILGMGAVGAALRRRKAAPSLRFT